MVSVDVKHHVYLLKMSVCSCKHNVHAKCGLQLPHIAHTFSDKALQLQPTLVRGGGGAAGKFQSSFHSDHLLHGWGVENESLPLTFSLPL